MSQLRDYQERAVFELRTVVKYGHRSPLLVAPCGAGKTAIAGEVIKRARERGQVVLFLAPRRELVYQVCERLESLGLSYGVIMAGESPSLLPDIQVASIDTLYARAVRRDKIPLPKARLVLVDEAHVGVWGQAQDIIEHYKSEGAVVLGLTATPCRTDGVGLGAIYDRLVMGPSVKELTDKGWLVPARYFRGEAPDVDGVKVQGGDYVNKQLAERVDKPLIGRVVENWLRLAADRPTFLYAPSVATSRWYCEEFQKHGIRAEHIDGHTDNEERKAIQQRLRDGETQVLCNCGAPETEFITQEYGPVTLAESAGKRVTVRCLDGRWRQAEVRHFGRQRLQRLTFTRVGPGRWPHSRVERFTSNHRWILEDGSVTDNIEVGDVLATTPSESNLDATAVLHGIVYGDGSVSRPHKRRRESGAATGIQGTAYATLRVCKQDSARDEIVRWFERAGYEANYPNHAKGDPVFYLGRLPLWKELPFTNDPEYIAGFIHGWWLADGSKTESPDTRAINTINQDAAYWLERYAVYAGLTCLSHIVQGDRNRHSGVYDNAKPLYAVRLRYGVRWKLSEITEDSEDDVFCVVEPETQSFTLASQLITGNCLVLTYGVDFPPVSCIVMACPTKSLTKYLQCVGRGLRTHDGKSDCYVLDHAHVTSELGFADDEHPWSLDGKEKIQERKAKEQKQPDPIECPNCGSVIRPAPVCPDCGHRMESRYKKAMQEHEADLEEVERAGAKKNGRQYTMADKERWFAELKGHAKQNAERKGKQYKPGYAVNLYKEKFGSLPWPVYNTPAREPQSEDVLGWLKYKRIKWAKRRTA